MRNQYPWVHIEIIAKCKLKNEKNKHNAHAENFKVFMPTLAPQGEGAHLKWRVSKVHKRQEESTLQWGNLVSATSLVNKASDCVHKSCCKFIPFTPCEQDGRLPWWLSSSNPQPQFNHEKPIKHIQIVEPILKTMMIIKNKEGLREKKIWRAEHDCAETSGSL